jgi:hypothetical protein
LPLDPTVVVDLERERVDGTRAEIELDDDELHLTWTDSVGRHVEVWAEPGQADSLRGRLERCRGRRCDEGRVELRPLWSGAERERGYRLLAELDDPSSGGGRVLALDVNDDLVALALGSAGVALVDATDPKDPSVVYREANRDPDEWVNDVLFVEGDYLLVASSSRGLRVLDVSSPDAPFAVVDTFPGPRREVHSLFLDRERLYLSRVGTFGGLDVVDLADPARPRLLRELTVPGCDQVHATFARETTLLLSCLDQGLFAFDLSDAFTLEPIAHDAELGSHSARLQDDGETLLATSERYEGALRVLHLDRDAGAFNRLATVTLGSAASVHEVSCRGERCTVSHYQEGVFELDLRDPSSPRVGRRFPTWNRAALSFLEGASDAVVVPPRVYVADTTRGLLVLERE